MHGEKWRVGRGHIGFCFLGTPDRSRDGYRGRVGGFSYRSSRRLSAYLQDSEAEYGIMATLTYPAGEHWLDAKRHLRAFVERYRRYCLGRFSGERWSCCWFVEFQRRGAAHFHLFLTHPVEKSRIANWWYEIVGSGDERHLRAGTRIEKLREGRRGAAAYARKYATKLEQKVLPALLEGTGFGRWWGVCGHRKTVAATTWYGHRERLNHEARESKKTLYSMLELAFYDGSARRYETPYGVHWYFTRITPQVERCYVAFALFTQAIAQCRSSAPTSPTGPSREHSRRMTLLGLSVE